MGKNPYPALMELLVMLNNPVLAWLKLPVGYNTVGVDWTKQD